MRTTTPTLIAAVALIACGENKVSFDTLETQRSIANDNSRLMYRVTGLTRLAGASPVDPPVSRHLVEKLAQLRSANARTDRPQSDPRK